MMTSHTVQPDAIIIGAGPVGCYAALNLAKLGANVSIFEEHPQIGLPAHCAGHISIRSLRNMGLYPLPCDIIENTFKTANFYSPIGTKFSLHLSQPVTCALSRARFDQFLARQAQQSGANFSLSTRVQSLICSDGSVKGVNIQQNGTIKQVNSKIVLDSEGISSRLLRQASLKALRPQGLVFAVEAEIENVQDIEKDAVEVYFGRSYAPGFYGWLIPKLDGTAKLGLATNKGNPQMFLQRLMKKHPIAHKQLSKAKITQIGYHAISLGGPIERSYGHGFLAIGDCASQVKPTTGGGVIFGLQCAKIAAETANQAIKEGDVSSKILQQYQKRCSSLLGFDFLVMLRLRRFLNSLADAKVDEMLRFCSKLGVDHALSDVDEIDFQGKMLLTAMCKPAMTAALAYFALLYLSANP